MLYNRTIWVIIPKAKQRGRGRREERERGERGEREEELESLRVRVVCNGVARQRARAGAGKKETQREIEREGERGKERKGEHPYIETFAYTYGETFLCVVGGRVCAGVQDAIKEKDGGKQRGEQQYAGEPQAGEAGE